MANQQKLPHFEEQESIWEASGIFAPKDWRYEALVDYLKLSPSYKLVCDWARNDSNVALPLNAPKDWGKLVRTYKDFGDVFRIRESDWWDMKGKNLFGINAAKAQSFTVGFSDEKSLLPKLNQIQSEQIWANMAQPNCIVLAIPANQTKQMAIKQITAIIRANSFTSKKPKPIKPKYELIRSKLREHTIKLGTIALKMYQRRLPLWLIGNKLNLSPAHSINLDKMGNLDLSDPNIADKKIRLQILASKLVAKAELISENAARGIYPSDSPCKYALKFTSQTRKAGRPSKSK